MEDSYYPGTHKKPFTIKLDRDQVKPHDIINYAPYSVKLEVIKVYKSTWWRRVLLRLGFAVKLSQAKVVKTDTPSDIFKQ